MGRQLASYDNTTYSYNESGIRTSKTVGENTTEFYLNGTNIIYQTDGTSDIYFFYDMNNEIVGLIIKIIKKIAKEDNLETLGKVGTAISAFSFSINVLKEVSDYLYNYLDKEDKYIKKVLSGRSNNEIVMILFDRTDYKYTKNTIKTECNRYAKTVGFLQMFHEYINYSIIACIGFYIGGFIHARFRQI